MKPIREVSESTSSGVYFAGNVSPDAKIRLRDLMNASGENESGDQIGATPDVVQAKLDWQPVEVLQQLIAEATFDTVGGVPQLLKVYQYGASEAFVWRQDSRDYFGGREVKHGERFDRRIAEFKDGRVILKHSDRSMASRKEDLVSENDEV